METRSAATVQEFKDEAKRLIKESKFKDAVEFVNINASNKLFSKLQLKDDLLYTHWWTKVCLKAGDLRSLDSVCLTRINTLINLLITKDPKPKSKEDDVPLTIVQIDEYLAELLYLLRAVDTMIQHHDAEKGLRLFNQIILHKDCDPANRTNFVITKYYVKCLIQYDEHQLAIEPKSAFENLKQAETLNRTVLIKLHQHNKESIRI